MTPTHRILALGLLAAVCAIAAAPGTKPPAVKTDAEPLAGTWLLAAASEGKMTALPRGWTSKLTVTGDTFALSKFMGLSKELKGKFVLDPAASPRTIDLHIEECGLSESGFSVKIPACKLPGIYKLDGDRLTICFTRQPGEKRPTAFAAGGTAVLLTLARAPEGFKEFPKEVTVKVTGSDGKPAAGVTVTGSMNLREDRKKNGKRDWEYHRAVKTGTDGTVKVKYDDLRSSPVLVRDIEGKRMAIVTASPYSLCKGEVSVTLQPECRVTGTLVCEELKKLGKPVGWTNVYAMKDGFRFAMCDSQEGKFELVLPPGKYTLNAYGSTLKDTEVTVTVPTGRSEFVVDPIALTASKLALLEGQPAPELEGVVGWKGKKVTLAELKGKIVLLEFWGYWCGPCVGAMPVLIELHEKFADKGLVIVGVHRDIAGEVDTAAKLDEKIANFKKKVWNNKDLPFPVALVAGKGEGDAKAGGAPEQYGVLGWPTTVLIGRDGKVVGKFAARDVKAASKEIEKLLRR
jgi:uncharacterized protein (TIGR03067 family)